MRIVLIVNPKAGKVNISRIRAVQYVLERYGADTSVLETTGPGHATTLAREAGATRPDMVMTAGGDGTINEAANGLIGSGVPLAILPFGTANVLAREIGLPLNPVDAARVCCTGHVENIHLGMAAERRFLLMVGAGFDAAVVRYVKGAVKARIGWGAYVLGGMRLLARPWRSRYCVTTRDRSIESAASVIVANAAQYAGRWLIAPEASLFHRGLDVCVFHRSRRRDMVRYALAIVRGQHTALPDVEMLRTDSVRIEGGPEDHIQIDGDLAGTLPVDICIEARPLSLIVPAETADHAARASQRAVMN